MAKIILNQNEFFELIPLLVLTALNNSDMIDSDSPAANFFDDIEKKVLPKLRQYYREIDPIIRRKLKFLRTGIEDNTDTVITIKSDPEFNGAFLKKSSGTAFEKKYLTENYKCPAEIALKYLRS